MFHFGEGSCLGPKLIQDYLLQIVNDSDDCHHLHLNDFALLV